MQEPNVKVSFMGVKFESLPQFSAHLTKLKLQYLKSGFRKIIATDKKYLHITHERPRWSVEIAVNRLNLWKDYCEELLNKESFWAYGLEIRDQI